MALQHFLSVYMYLTIEVHNVSLCTQVHLFQAVKNAWYIKSRLPINRIPTVTKGEKREREWTLWNQTKKIKPKQRKTKQQTNNYPSP